MKRAPVVLTPAEIAFARGLVIHEDAAALALAKPAGLSSQGGRIAARTLDDLLWAFARSNGKRPELVHRLDRDTSGVILAAKTKPAAAFLGKAFAARRVEKTYLALVARAPEPAEGLIEAPLRREFIGREAYMRVCADGDPGAEPSATAYRTLAVGVHAALVEARPKTGRMHQVRVHLQSLGRPILGDPRYGGALTLAGEAAPRLMLHARALSFPHPDGGRLALEAAPPMDFATLARRAGVALTT